MKFEKFSSPKKEDKKRQTLEQLLPFLKPSEKHIEEMDYIKKAFEMLSQGEHTELMDLMSKVKKENERKQKDELEEPEFTPEQEQKFLET